MTEQFAPRCMSVIQMRPVVLTRHAQERLKSLNVQECLKNSQPESTQTSVNSSRMDNKWWCIYTMKYYVATIKNKPLLYEKYG